MKRVLVIGDGGWGTALAMVLQRNGHDVCVWGPFAEYIDEVRTCGENRKFLAGVALPEALTWTADPAEAAAGADAAVIVVPSAYYRSTLEKFRGVLPHDLPLVSATKGFDRETRHRMTTTAEEVLDRGSVAALSGPSHAEEVARGVPSAVVTACRHHATAALFQNLFNQPAFRVYTSDDTAGVELGGALKNVVAVAAGISDGIGFGDNTKSALITRGLAETMRLGAALGARASTFSGLSGIGDLIVTCTSRHSRNRAVGERLGRGESLADIQAGTEQVAEGVWNCTHARDLAAEQGVEVPITMEVHAVVHDGKDPHAAVEDLLARDPRPESDPS